MARGDKGKYSEKQKRQAEHIEECYERRGTSAKEAKRRAWATVNKETGGGKKSGSGRGQKTSHASSRKGGHKGAAASAHRSAAQRSASARKAARTRARRGH
ncbi:MAG TPA: plasmid stabilization protein [Gemmataceae bacterium]|nr:plasmid stabilization protein [Gemmataceae bacterium]